MSKSLKYKLRMLASRLGKDRKSLDPKVPLARTASHANYMDFLVKFANKEGMRVL
jgi:hypothetical protein